MRLQILVANIFILSESTSTYCSVFCGELKSVNEIEAIINFLLLLSNQTQIFTQETCEVWRKKEHHYLVWLLFLFLVFICSCWLDFSCYLCCLGSCEFHHRRFACKWSYQLWILSKWNLWNFTNIWHFICSKMSVCWGINTKQCRFSEIKSIS